MLSFFCFSSIGQRRISHCACFESSTVCISFVSTCSFRASPRGVGSALRGEARDGRSYNVNDETDTLNQPEPRSIIDVSCCQIEPSQVEFEFEAEVKSAQGVHVCRPPPSS